MVCIKKKTKFTDANNSGYTFRKYRGKKTKQNRRS